MSKTFFTITALSLTLVGLTACMNAAGPTSKPPGTYKSSHETTGADGTKRTTDQTTYVYRDPSGDKKAVVQTETTKDPKGLFNKQKSETTKSYQ